MHISSESPYCLTKNQFFEITVYQNGENCFTVERFNSMWIRSWFGLYRNATVGLNKSHHSLLSVLS